MCASARVAVTPRPNAHDKKGQRLLNIFLCISPLGSAAATQRDNPKVIPLATWQSPPRPISMLTYRNRTNRTRTSNPESRARATSHPDFITFTKRRQSRVLASHFLGGQTGKMLHTAETRVFFLFGSVAFVVRRHYARFGSREFMCCDVVLLGVRACLLC